MTYDLFMLLVVVVTIAWGLWKGFAWQLASLVSIFSSYGAAYGLRLPVAKMIDADPPLNMFAAMLIVYLLSSVGVWVAFGLVSTAINGLRLNDFDRQLGGLFGAAQGALLCLVITFFAVTLSGPRQQEAICQSRSGRYIAIMLQKSGGLIPPELHAVVDPFLNPFAEKLEHYQASEPAATPALPAVALTAPPQTNQPAYYPAQAYDDYPPSAPAPPAYGPRQWPEQPYQNPRYQPSYDPRYDPHYVPHYDPRLDPRYDPRFDQRYNTNAPEPQQPIDPRYNPRYEPVPRQLDPQYADPRYAPAPPQNYFPPDGYQPADSPNYYWR